jgi:hypothetical protein
LFSFLTQNLKELNFLPDALSLAKTCAPFEKCLCPVDFYVFGNSLVGTIPAGMFVLENLEYIDLSSNQFSGSLPLYVKQWTKLNKIFLHNNTFTGPIPVEFGFLKTLELLDLAGNNFIGTMPDQICQLKNESLHMLSADCSGSMPIVVCDPSCCTDCH